MLAPVYIKGLSTISPQKTFKNNVFPNEIVVSRNNLLRCIEPAYSEYLNPVMARRMGRVIKMGIAAALECLRDARVEMPGAIITGTALGCLSDTEKFLTAIIKDDEQFLTPTHFIQSIQNTVSAQIALHLKCMNHNFTFVHKGFSFESALIDAMMMLQERESDDILVGGLDEMTDHNFHIYNRLNIWKKEHISSSDLFNDKTPGTIGGEGASFFVLSHTPGDNDYAILKSVKTIYNPTGVNEVESAIQNMLNESNIGIDELSLCLYGINGDEANDAIFYNMMKRMMKDVPAGCFKHLCGEYQTAGAFAMWLAAIILHSQIVSDVMYASNIKCDKLSNILICYRYENNFSLMLLSKVNE